MRVGKGDSKVVESTLVSLDSRPIERAGAQMRADRCAIPNGTHARGPVTSSGWHLQVMPPVCHAAPLSALAFLLVETRPFCDRERFQILGGGGIGFSEVH